MLKTDALERLGGSVTAAAELIGITPSAVSQWPDVLPPALIDRVIAAQWRQAQGIPAPTPQRKADAAKAAA